MTETYEQNMKYWESCIIHEFKENLDLFGEFEINSFNRTCLRGQIIFKNGYQLTDITKKEFLQILIKVLTSKYQDYKYIISTRAKNDTSHYYIVASLIQEKIKLE